MLYYGDKYRKINPLTSEILNLENKLVEIDFFFSSSGIGKKVRKPKNIKEVAHHILEILLSIMGELIF